jgi:uracil-DNA glycosylase
MTSFYEQRLELLQAKFDLDFLQIDSSTVYDRDFVHKKGENICLIGEAPGEKEVLNGKPFCGPAGANLAKLIALSAIPRERFCITNGFCFRTFAQGVKGAINRAPNKQELTAGAYLLAQELELLRPKVIILLGNSALKAVMLLQDGSLKDGLKELGRHEMCTLFSEILGADVLVAKAFHPSPLVFNQVAKRARLEQFFTTLPQWL